MFLKFSKYWQCLKILFYKQLEWRTELITWVLLHIIPNLLLVLIWLAAYPPSATTGGYSLPELLQYFLLGGLINDFTSTHFETWRCREIREGKIDYAMTKPMSYPVQVLLNDIASKCFYLTLSVPAFVVIYTLMSRFFPLAPFHFSLWQLAQFMAMIAVAYVVEFSFAMMTVLLTFWFEGSSGLEHFKWIVITIFSGWMIPVAFMPLWLQRVVNFLPLRYMYTVPIAILQAKYALQLSDVFNVGIFIGGLMLILHFTWHKAVAKYTSAGG